MSEESLINFSGKVRQSTFEQVGEQKALSGETNGQVIDSWAHTHKKFPVRQKEKEFMFNGVTKQLTHHDHYLREYVKLEYDKVMPNNSEIYARVDQAKDEEL